MYLNHFGLERRPFSITPDPSLMVWTTQHRRVFDGLTAALSASHPARLAVLTGEIGCGKSTILRACLDDRQIADRFQAALISITVRSARELIEHVFLALDGGISAGDADAQFEQVKKVFSATARRGLRPLLVLDEAQTMSDDAGLLLARFLSDEIEPAHAPSVILAGQPELDPLLARPVLASLAGKIDVRFRLGQMSKEETDGFIRGRLSRAGASVSNIFDPEAVDLVQKATRGTPRLVNKACDLCLFAAARDGRPRIDARFAQRVLEQFGPLGVTAPEEGANANLPFLDDFDLPTGRVPVAEAAAAPVDGPDAADLRDGEALGKTHESQPAIAPAAPARRKAIFGFLRGAGAGVALCALVLLAMSYLDLATTNGIPSTAAVEAPEYRVGAPSTGLRFPIGFEPEASVADFRAWDGFAEPATPAPDGAAQEDGRNLNAMLAAEIHSSREELRRLNREIESAERNLAALRERRNVSPPAGRDRAPASLAMAEPTTGPVSVLQVPLLTPLPPSAGQADAEAFFAQALASTALSEIAVNYARAALRGHRRAARYLGQLFETGDGVALDAGIAGRWYAVARNPDQIHIPRLAAEFASRGPMLAVPLASAVTDGEGDFVWSGRGSVFTVEIADAGSAPIARARTSLTAIRLPVPAEAVFWRVRSDDTQASDWQQIGGIGE